MFRPGDCPTEWPHRDDAISLFRRIWPELRKLGQEPEWHILNMLNQVSGSSNWQHGELYLTPSVKTAVVYARDGARRGGELLRECAEALDKLAGIDRSIAGRVLSSAGSVQPLLSEDGWPPVLVQFDPVCVEDLLTENADSDVEGLLAQIDSKEGFMRDVVERQSNFRLVKGHGRIARVYVVEIDDDGDPCPHTV